MCVLIKWGIPVELVQTAKPWTTWDGSFDGSR